MGFSHLNLHHPFMINPNIISIYNKRIMYCKCNISNINCVSTCYYYVLCLISFYAAIFFNCFFVFFCVFVYLILFTFFLLCVEYLPKIFIFLLSVRVILILSIPYHLSSFYFLLFSVCCLTLKKKTYKFTERIEIEYVIHQQFNTKKNNTKGGICQVNIAIII